MTNSNGNGTATAAATGAPSDAAPPSDMSQPERGGPATATAAAQAAATDFRAGFPSPSAADNTALVEHLTRMINHAFTTSEVGIWDTAKPQFLRVTSDKTRDLLRARELAFVWKATRQGQDLDAALREVGPACILASARLHWAEPGVGDVSLVASVESVRGRGVGRAVMRFAEEHFKQQGGRAVQIELLVPQATAHPDKVRLDAWYQRMGFKPIRIEEFDERYPELAPLLAGECKLKVYERPI